MITRLHVRNRAEKKLAKRAIARIGILAEALNPKPLNP